MGWVDGLLTLIGAVAEAATEDKKDRARIIAEPIAAHEGAAEPPGARWRRWPTSGTRRAGSFSAGSPPSSAPRSARPARRDRLDPPRPPARARGTRPRHHPPPDRADRPRQDRRLLHEQ